MNSRAVHAAYYLAHTAKSLLWTASDLATIYALVSLYRMDPDEAGWLFLAGLAVSGLADFAVGQWLDRHPRGTPLLALLGLVLAALAFPYTMLAGDEGPSGLLVATLAFRIAYAAYDVPHNALLSRLVTSARAATRLAKGRTLGTGAAAALVGLGLVRMDDVSTLPRLLWGLAAIALLGGLALIPLLRRLPPTLSSLDDVSRGPGLPWQFLLGSLIGIVALGALGKAILHLPAGVAQPAAGTMVVVLTLGRTAAALLPIGFTDVRWGLRLLGATYLGGVLLVWLLLHTGGWLLPLTLGLLLGVTNQLGWALLPLLASRSRSFGLYAMIGKLGLGIAGVAMTAALGERPVFANNRLAILAAAVIAGCALAALLLGRRDLTASPSPDGPRL